MKCLARPASKTTQGASSIFHGGRRGLLALPGPARPALLAQAQALVQGPVFPGAGKGARTGRHALCEEVARAAAGSLEGTRRVTPQILCATHQAAVRTVLEPLLHTSFGERRRPESPVDLAELSGASCASRPADGLYADLSASARARARAETAPGRAYRRKPAQIGAGERPASPL